MWYKKNVSSVPQQNMSHWIVTLLLGYEENIMSAITVKTESSKLYFKTSPH